ncbi:MAG: hypothetical protein ABR586_08500 [Thermoplasmatota archaeon]
MHLRLDILAVAAAASLAGCTLPDTTTTETGGVVATAETYTVTLLDFNGQSNPLFTQAENFTWPVVLAGSDFNFTEKFEGSAVLQSDHIGGHFGMNRSDAPSTTTYPTGCTHVKGVLPQVYTIVCRAPAAPGTYHLRGHGRVTQGDKMVSWWSPDFTFRVA